MVKLSVALSEKEAQHLLEQLSPVMKINLVRRWEKKFWPERFRQLMDSVKQACRENPELARQAKKDIGPARRAFYARRHRY